MASQQSNKPWVDLLDGDVHADGDVLDGLAALADDAYRLGDSLCRNWMVASNHNDLK